MRYKPKIKYKLKAAVMAAFLGLMTCVTSISASAALWNGLGAGATEPSSYLETSTPFGVLTSSNNLTWRVDLYVSANPDGKINESSDTIGSTALPLVGSLYCVPEGFGSEWNDRGQYTYIQTNYTNESRDQFNSKGYTVTKNFWTGDISGKTYTLPTLQFFNPQNPTYTDTSGNTVAISTRALKLFDGQWYAATGTNFEKVSNILHSEDAGTYTSELIEQLGAKIGKKAFLSKVVSLVSQQVFDNFSEKAKTMNVTDAVGKYLLPDSPDCMVEWAMVITPIYRFECNEPFYYYTTSGTEGMVKYGGYGNENDVALDAYWFAQYNCTTIPLAAAGLYPGTVTYTRSSGETVTKAVIPSNGGLAFWLQPNEGNAASAAYSTEKKDPTLGVYVNKNNWDVSDWRTAVAAYSQPAEYAKRGGISVFILKIETPETPVYYHTYTYTLDENNPPDGYNPDQSYTQEQLLQFVEKLPDPEVTVSQGDLPDKNAELYYPAKDTNATSKGTVTEAMTPSTTVFTLYHKNSPLKLINLGAVCLAIIL